MGALNDDEKWEGLSAEIEECSGKRYDPEDLKNIEFCYKEVGRLGFSMSVTFLPDWHFKEEWAEHGVEPTKEKLKALGDGKYSYQLLGGIYKDRGDHPCPLMDTPELAAATALFNVARLKAHGRI